MVSSAGALLTLTLRTWVRYLVPLTLLSALAFCAFAYVAFRTHGALDIVEAQAQLRLGWILVGFAWIAQLALVAGVTPAVQVIAIAIAPSQFVVLRAGCARLVRAILPTLVATIVIAIGGLALVIPGLVLFAMLAMTGASERLDEPLPAPLTDSIAAARNNLIRIAVLAGALLALDFAIGGIAQLAIVHALKKPTTTAALVATHKFVRVIAISLIVMSPLPACALAAAYQGVKSRTP
jgi:hypothetical protein